MVQLIAAVGLGAVALYAYKSLQDHLQRLDEEDTRAKLNEQKAVTELEQDPETGIYRPKK
ncbi:MAG: hypothetical protein AAFO73_10170 [Pseudomonadota bacterium]